MIICRECYNIVSDDLARCPFCSEELDRREPVEEEIEWKIVRTTSREIDARLMAGRLRTYDIPAFVLSQVDSARGFTVGALAVVKVFVPGSMLEQAEEILALPPIGPADEPMTGGLDEDEHGDDDRPDSDTHQSTDN